MLHDCRAIVLNAPPVYILRIMSNQDQTKPALRIRDHYVRDGKPNKYERTYEVIDAQSGVTLLHCDIVGHVALRTQTMIDEQGHAWRLEPNRKLMPSRWDLRNTDGSGHWQFRQKALGMLVNPFQKTVMSISDGDGVEQLQLADLHGAKLPVVLGLEWGKYALVRNNDLLATLTHLPREQQPEGKGLLGRIRRFLHASDAAFVSTGDTHPLPPPALLAVYLLYREFTDSSAG